MSMGSLHEPASLLVGEDLAMVEDAEPSDCELLEVRATNDHSWAARRVMRRGERATWIRAECPVLDSSRTVLGSLVGSVGATSNSPAALRSFS
jgi:hypothetical protein